MGTNNKLREALKLCADEMCNRCRANAALQGDLMPCINGCEPVRKAKAALAESVKNCEVGTAEEQTIRFKKFCLDNRTENDFGCGDCPCYSEDSGKDNCGILWAQMPYEEGDNNENK